MRNWGIYVHVPWCRRRCHYCDFYFEVGKAQEGFAQKVLTEFNARRFAEMPQEQKAHTVYFGGGTPSALPASEIAQMVTSLQQTHQLQDNAEVTVELNPEDISQDYAEQLAVAGVNRASLGMQSLDDSILRLLSRKHRAKDAINSIQWLMHAGIRRISVDFIVGVPGENVAQIKQAIMQCAELGVTHFSVYLLTVEENTPLYRLIQRQKFAQPDDDIQADTYAEIQDFLNQQGFRQYEISSYAKPGHESQHNRLYWSKGEYLGLGPGAHSLQLLKDGSALRRHTNAKLVEWWQDPLAAAKTQEVLTPSEAFREALAFGIRDLVAGIDLAQLAQRYQLPGYEAEQAALSKLMHQGYVYTQDNRYFLTPTGARFADAVARDLLV